MASQSLKMKSLLPTPARQACLAHDSKPLKGGKPGLGSSMIACVHVGGGGGRYRAYEHRAGRVAMGQERPPQGCLRPRRRQRDRAGKVTVGSLGVPHMS